MINNQNRQIYYFIKSNIMDFNNLFKITNTLIIFILLISMIQIIREFYFNQIIRIYINNCKHCIQIYIYYKLMINTMNKI